MPGFNSLICLGRQLVFEPAERAVRKVWDPDSPLARPPPAETRGAAGVPPSGDQEGAQGMFTC